MQNEKLNEQSGSKQSDRNPGNTSGMSVGSQVNVGPTKYVDGNEFDGDRGGDTRKQAAPAVLPPQPGPRGQTTNDPNAGA